jgi:putative ABC transport system substrate-binding protein
MRRIGVLLTRAADDPEAQARIAALHQGLRDVGLIDGRNVEIDLRWGGADANRFRQYAAELVALAPDVIVAIGGSAVGPLLQETRTVPIVFTNTTDPVGAGFVASLARPGGNVTGFLFFEYSIGTKWLELLKQIEPRTTRAAILRDSAMAGGIGEFSAIQSAASSAGVELTPIEVRDTGALDRAVAAFARVSNGGLIVLTGPVTAAHRDLIIALAARHRLPAVYPFRYYASEGGLLSYGPSTIDPVRRAAGYIDRILKGEKPADMPVQAPTKYGLVINLKTAKALGLSIPTSLLASADEVIE